MCNQVFAVTALTTSAQVLYGLSIFTNSAEGWRIMMPSGTKSFAFQRGEPVAISACVSAIYTEIE
jgi:hypothetical protein